MKKVELINFLLIAGLSLVAGMWSFLAFAGVDGGDVPEWATSGDMVLEGSVSVDELSVLTRNGRDSLVLMPGAEADLTWNAAEKHLEVDLSSGSLVMAALADDMEISVSTGFARIDSAESVAFVNFDDEAEQVEVFAETHPSLITFTLEGEDLNALSLPTGHRMKVSKAKVTPTLEKLRLAKLSKEFPIFLFDGDDLSEGVEVAHEDLETQYEESELRFLNNLAKDSDFGPGKGGLSASINSAYKSFKRLVTVLPHAKDRLELDQGDNSLLYAMSNALYGSQEEHDFWLNEWLSVPKDENSVRELRSSMFFVLPGDPLYRVKSAATDVYYGSEDVLDNLSRRYGEIESLTERASVIQAQGAYDEYKQIFEAALASGRLDDVMYLGDISREYMLVELLLRQNSIFYNVDSVELLSDLEETILALAASKQDLDEERQAFIQSRLRFLDNLFDFVVERKVSIDEATDLASELLFQAEDYLNAISSEVAVSSYFKGKLEEFDLAIDFINSPEFFAYDDFDEGLEAYSEQAEDLDALNEYIQSLREGDVSDEEVLPLEEALAEVEKDLRGKGIRFSSLVSLDDAENRLFEIKGGRTKGNTFEANYDRGTQIFYDVRSEGLRFSAGIHLDSFSDVLDSALSAEEESFVDNEEDEPSEDNEEANRTDDLAIQYAESQFEEAGLDSSLFTFRVQDAEANLFSFEGVITPANLAVSGNFNGNTNEVNEVVWIADGAAQTLPSLDLEGMEEAIYSTYLAISEVSV